MYTLSFLEQLQGPFGMGASLIGYVLIAVILTGIAGKLHEKDVWMAWVPLLNVAYLYRLAGMS